jgi:hypothetical protein
VVYRFGDMASGWLHTGLGALGLTLAGTAFAAIPVSLVGVAVGVSLARQHARIARAEATTGANHGTDA